MLRSATGEIPVPDGGLSIGSDPWNGLVVPGAEPFHCRVFVEGSTAIVQDLLTRSGTFLNGEAIGESALRSGDEIRVGSAAFRCAESAMAESARSARLARRVRRRPRARRSIAPGIVGGAIAIGACVAFLALRPRGGDPLDDGNRGAPDRRVASLEGAPDDPPGRGPASAPAAADLPEVDAFVRAGRFGEALHLLRMSFEEPDAARASALRVRYREVYAVASRALEDLVREGEGHEAEGRLDQALAFYERFAPDFPAAGALSDLTEHAARLRVRIDASRAKPAVVPLDSTPPRPASAPAWSAGRPIVPPTASAPAHFDPDAAARVDALVAAAREHEGARRFDEAHGAFEAARAAASDEPTRARLAGLAVDAKRQVWFLSHLADAAATSPAALKEVDLGPAAEGAPVGGDAAALELEGPRGRTRLAWSELPAAAFARLFARTRPGARDELHAAVFFLRTGLAREADRALGNAAKDPTLRAEVDAVLARHRGVEMPPGGFVRFKDRWMPAAERDALLVVEEIGRLVARLDGADEKARGTIVAELKRIGADAKEPLVEALRRRRASGAAKLAASPLTKRLDGVREARLELDRRRAHALALIFDEEAYFYPYQPPACPPERAREYWPVQHDVDARVAAVREAWNAGEPVVLGKWRRTLRDFLELDAWIAEAEGEADAPVAGVEAWLGVDPAAEEVTVRNYALGPKERVEAFETDARVLAFNATAGARYGWTAEERREIDVTNAYRRLLGRRALAVNARLLRAARGHCLEMESLGYFSHFSPTSGRRTPFDRMKREGYERGVSENLARARGPDDAHDGWTHSSGHHRNLLDPRHREIGVGAAGTLWTQNFGQATDYLAEPEWK